MKEVYKIEKFESPVVKSYKDVEKYDVARFEYGDYDNWVDAIILDIKVKLNENKVPIEAEIHFAYSFGPEETCYSFASGGDIQFDIIGKAKKLENDMEKEEQAAPMSM